jgi:hypothetical protein
MPEYVGFTDAAVHNLVMDRKIQSPDYSEHSELLNIFSGNDDAFLHLSKSLIVKKVKSGIVVFSRSESYSKEKNTLTFDLSGGAIAIPNSNNLLTCLLKVFRFCIRYWNRHPLNNNEYLPPGSSKAIIFPYPISHGGAFRVAIEREPNKKRIEKRFTGTHLLAYKFGVDEGKGLSEEAPLTQFNKSVDLIFDSDSYVIKGKQAGGDERNGLNVVKLGINESKHICKANWNEMVSSVQKGFISGSIDFPSRIEGPAGSGKTLCLILKAITALSAFHNDEKAHRCLFLVPTNEIAGRIAELVSEYSDVDFFSDTAAVSIEIKTLQEKCKDILGEDISDYDFLDIDTIESRNMQLLYLSEIIEGRISSLSKYERLLSKHFCDYLRLEHCLTIADLVMHEISVVIKGRCNESMDVYRDASRPKHALPLETTQDREFVFSIFTDYIDKLTELSVFDSDDIVLSAIQKLDNNINRRRRKKEGYDSIFVDEVHLFSFNELSMIHYLTKGNDKTPVSVAIDVSQALGDIAWSDADFYDAVNSAGSEIRTQLSAVFRSTPSITNLANSITSNGVSLFGNFVNCISDVSAIASGDDGAPPLISLCLSESEMIQLSIKQAESNRIQLECLRSEIAIVCFDRAIFDAISVEFMGSKKPVVILSKRSDFSGIKKAKGNNSFILCMAEHVGGLEFESVILVGVDKGRVPPENQISSTASRMYHNYMAHNKLYVAVSRAKKLVNIFCEKARGVSIPLEPAIKQNLVQVVEL